MKFYALLLIALASFTNPLQAQTGKEIDALVEEAIETYKDNPKGFYNRMQELESLPDFNDSERGIFFLGYCYYSGYGVFTDKSKGLEYLYKAAAMNSQHAHNMLSIHYASIKIDSRAELEERIRINLKGAELGDGLCMWQLFLLYLDGKGSLEKDPNKAVAWLKESARREFPRGCTALGRLYKRGYLVDKDTKQAFRLFEQAAELKDEEAYVELAKCYQEGVGTKYSCAVGQQWLEKGIKEDIGSAYYQQGMNFKEGICVEKVDMEKAKYWFRQGVRKGDSRAKEELSIIERREAAERNRRAAAQARPQTPSNSRTSPSVRNSTTSRGWTYSSLIQACREELPSYSSRYIDQDVEQGASYTIKEFGISDHAVRFVVNEGTRPGYYPIIKMTYYGSDDEVEGTYTTTSAHVKRYGDHLTVVKANIGDFPLGIRKVRFEIVRCSGRLISTID